MLYQANSALKKDPQNPQLYLERATAHMLLGEIDHALDDLGRTIELKWMNMNRPCPTSTGR